MVIKIHDPDIGKSEVESAKSVISSHMWSISDGTGKVANFEKKFKNYTESQNCVAVNSGTAALHLALSLHDVNNKEVIIPSLAYVSVAQVVKYCGGIPVFVDIDPNTLCMDMNKVEKSITKNTKIIMPVHFAGIPCELDRLNKLVKGTNIEIIEDAAHAVGSKYNQKKIGSHSNTVCFSFHPVKTLPMLKGGAVTLNGTNIEKVKNELIAKRCCGISNKNKIKYEVEQLGWNYYMDEVSAAIGIEQLKKINQKIKKRNEIAKRYFKEIKLNHKMPFQKDTGYNFYWIIVKNRNRFIKNMAEKGIETANYHTPIHKLKLFKNKKQLKVTEAIDKKMVIIPCHSSLKEQEVDKIIKITNQLCEK